MMRMETLSNPRWSFLLPLSVGHQFVRFLHGSDFLDLVLLRASHPGSRSSL